MYALPWLRQLQRHWSPRRVIRPAPVRRRAWPCLEVLEDRTVPANFNVGAGDVATWIATINTANSNGQSNTINLPFAVLMRTPQGQLLGGMQLALLANGTPVLESLNAQGLVVSALPL